MEFAVRRTENTGIQVPAWLELKTTVEPWALNGSPNTSCAVGVGVETAVQPAGKPVTRNSTPVKGNVPVLSAAMKICVLLPTATVALQLRQSLAPNNPIDAPSTQGAAKVRT